jgi:hypothetical protein
MKAMLYLNDGDRELSNVDYEAKSNLTSETITDVGTVLLNTMSGNDRDCNIDEAKALYAMIKQE